MIKPIRARALLPMLSVGLTALLGVCHPAKAAMQIQGQVEAGHGAVAGSTVSLWVASADAPVRLAQTQTDASGKFAVSVDQSPNGMPILYLTASGGTPAANTAGRISSGLGLLAVLGPTPPAKVVVNELTTVASAFTNARFIKGEAISGNPLGLKIAAGNVPNLVDPATGTWGKVLLDPLNSTQTTTLATLDTLASLISAFATVANDDWRASIMEQFRIMGAAGLRYPKPTGVINMIRPDGSQPVPAGFTGNGAVDIPWGLNLDGNDDVWIGNFKGRGVVFMAGDDTKGRPAGTKPGDVLHVFTGGSIQMLTDVSIDPAGNVWAANNWNAPDGAAGDPPVFPTSTWGGGSGLTVIYGVASPVKPPRIGKVQGY